MSRRESRQPVEALRHTSTNVPRRSDAQTPEAEGVDRAVEHLRAQLAENERTIRELREALTARDDFIARAAHELRNPMAAVLMGATNMRYLARTRPEGMPPWLVARVEGLERQARHFIRRATTLLDASRLAAGRASIEPQVIDLGVVVEAVVRELSPEAERAGSRLDVSIAAGIEGVWDPGAVESIASNLLSNAIKYGPGRPVGVRLTATPRLARIVVSDEGVGIPLHRQAKIFDRFERGDARNETPGFGIGLWIARELARAHGGDIAVDSAPGRGSIFTASLPRGIHGP